MKNDINITISVKGDNKKQLWREVLVDIIGGSVLILIGWIASKYLK